MRQAIAVRWTDGEIKRLRRHLDAAYEDKKYKDNPCGAVAKVAKDFGATAAEVREVIARAERTKRAERGMMETAAAHRPNESDIYAFQRGGIIQRMETGLHPHAPWRDPREVSAGLMFRADNTPWSHTLAGACVWLRKNPLGMHDVSSELLWCIVMQERCDIEAARVATALKHAWVDMHAPVAKHAQTPAGLVSIEDTAMILVSQIVTGVRTKAKIPVHWQLWRKMQESGERMLWALADRASRRAVAALR
jgi:hypothetical protein